MGLNIGAFCCLYAMGGGQNSTVTLCNALTRRGHRVTLYCAANQMFSHIQPEFDSIVEIPINKLEPRHFYNISPGGIFKTLSEVRKRQHDVILSFTYPSLMAAMPLLFCDGIHCVQYILGPIAPPLLKITPGTIVANSEETRDLIASRLGRPLAQVPVIRGRVDIDALDRDAKVAQDQTNPYSPPGGLLQISHMSTWHLGKLPAIRHALEALKILSQQRQDFRYVLAGEGPLRTEVEGMFAQANDAMGREAALAIGYVGDVARFLSAADIILGIGRCAWEGMALSKPTLVVGSRGFAGAVRPNQIDDLAYYNFAGRNLREQNDPAVLAQTLSELLCDPKRRQADGAYARKYMLENINCTSGARRFEELLLAEMAKPSLREFQKLRGWMSYVWQGLMWTAIGIAKHFSKRGRTSGELAKIERIQKTGEHCCLGSHFPNNTRLPNKTTVDSNRTSCWK